MNIVAFDQYHGLRSAYHASKHFKTIEILLAQRTFGVGCLNFKVRHHPQISDDFGLHPRGRLLARLHPDIIQISMLYSMSSILFF